ncbi:MAG: sulfur carrier protein ThiS [Phycisphaerae bacterium]|jgi:thiamine biosynthesis protein ThiS|nr:sulfur carrier protein ThiS [Phycisphaerae bacterium]HOO16473.1 sulfur carrier protein ThiS [Phycisphaerae bacterium]
MKVTINGQARTFEQPLTIAELLAQLEVHPLRVAIEVNEQLVRRADFAATQIREGDRIEVVTFVGGG